MDRHLNTFVGYERPPGHEDQLTRAAMIVMRAVPLARDAFLARVGEPLSGQLPAVGIDMQVRHVVETSALGEAETPTLRRLVSVFLSPDEGLDLTGATIRERDREQRLDGVLRFGDELVVVLESKIVGQASSEQASELRLRDVEVEVHRVVALGWHDLLQDWWLLLERELLGPAERVLVEDLIAYAEEHFSHLLPFTTLVRAGDHALRRQRRLMAILREASGLNDVRRRPPSDAEVLLVEALGTRCTQRVALKKEGEHLVLSTWPAELKPQAQELYRAGRAARLVDLDAREGWKVVPNPHLGFRGARTYTQRLYMACRLDLAEYVRRWTEEDRPRIGAHPFDTVRDELWPWLRRREYASATDDALLDPFLEGLGRRDAHLRPGIYITRTWPWSDAEARDERGLLVSDVRTAIAEVLEALDEPGLP